MQLHMNTYIDVITLSDQPLPWTPRRCAREPGIPLTPQEDVVRMPLGASPVQRATMI